jgi:hypothetical protein
LRRLKELVWVMFGLAVLGAHRLFADRQDSTLPVPRQAPTVTTADRPREPIIEVQQAQRGEFL